MQLPLKYNISESRILPVWITVILMLRIVITFTVFGFLQSLSYLVFAFTWLDFLIISFLYIRRMRMTTYGMSVFVYMMMIVVFTIINGTDIKTSIYNAMEIFSFLCLLSYYSNRLKLILYTIALSLSLAVYANLLIMIMFPDWMFAAENEFDSFLLGGNYNQMGCRMICAMIATVLCIRYDKKWIINIVFVALAALITLIMVGSMTALANILLFSFLCLIPSRRLLMVSLVGFFLFYVFFQCVVCFTGEGLHNNELAVYIIEDLMGKDLTFTNRTEMWDAAAGKFAESPIIGWGWVDSDWYTSQMSSAAIGPHNYIYSVLINGGLIGISVMILSCVIAVRRWWGCFDRTGLLLLLGTVSLLFMSCFEVYKTFFVVYLFAMIYYYPDFYKDSPEEEQIESETAAGKEVEVC